MTSCATYVADPSFQIGAGPTGGVDCTAHSFSDLIDASTCGAKDPGGRLIRLQSDEPIPDPRSPGLNLAQGARVAGSIYGVYTEVHTGARAVTWAEYERRRLAGQPAVIQLNYGPIADSRYDAFRSAFRGGHAIAETLHATYDPGAGPVARTGIFHFDGTVYDRALIRKAAGQLIVRVDALGHPLERVGDGFVWAAFGRDVVPNYQAHLPAGDYWAYAMKSGVVDYRSKRHTGGFTATCTPPKTYVWGSRRVTLVRLLTGRYAGRYVSSNYSKETP